MLRSKTTSLQPHGKVAEVLQIYLTATAIHVDRLVQIMRYHLGRILQEVYEQLHLKALTGTPRRVVKRARWRGRGRQGGGGVWVLLPEGLGEVS